MTYWLFAAAMMAPQALSAQGAAERTIQVTGTGIVQTMPDIALLDIYLRGEGTTPDAATSAIAAKQKAVRGGLTGLLGADSELTTSNVTIIEARNGACADARGYNSQLRISTGDCAVIGHIATIQMNVRTRAVEKAATAAGLASRLGASDARVQGFTLSDPEAAQGRANAAAIETARKKAVALASGAGLKLGTIVTVRDQANFDVVVSGALRRVSDAAAPAAPIAPAVVIDLKPKPLETRAQVFVTYAIES